MNRDTTIMGLAILAAATCAAGEQHKVAVCMRTTPTSEVFRAEAQASQMFASIGVKLDWSCGKSGLQPAIVISLATRTPENRKPGELAYALPYEGTHIVILYDRVRKMLPNQVPAVLAHVLVHEVTHILEGFPRHSESGVMKAHWDAQDFAQMTWNPLPFTADDVDLIHRALNAREARSPQVTCGNIVETGPQGDGPRALAQDRKAL
jgi:hypothetical protein